MASVLSEVSILVNWSFTALSLRQSHFFSTRWRLSSRFASTRPNSEIFTETRFGKLSASRNFVRSDPAAISASRRRLSWKRFGFLVVMGSIPAGSWPFSSSFLPFLSFLSHVKINWQRVLNQIPQGVASLLLLKVKAEIPAALIRAKQAW